jgi:putative nucleotidyltransferase with HDIG domain
VENGTQLSLLEPEPPAIFPTRLHVVDELSAADSRVLLLLEQAEDVAVARAALHLVGLQVRCAWSFETALATPPPLLVIYDDEIPASSPREEHLLAGLRRRGLPLLCVTGEGDRELADPAVKRPLSPLEVLGGASRAQPQLYEQGLVELVEPDLEDKLCLLTYDLRRATETAPAEGDAERLEVAPLLFEAAVALLDVLKLRDIETAFHCYRVRAYACRLAQKIAPWILDDPTVELGFLLHDIGKLALPDNILQKPGPLSPQERQLMHTHPLIGSEMARRLLGKSRGLNVIRSHHERWDGTGYPDQLQGIAIPIEARIFAVADALDAVTSDRPYREAEPWSTAIEILASDAGTHFDPIVIATLETDAETLRQLRPSSGAVRAL